MKCKVTPARLAWLMQLSQRGACPLKAMPKRAGSKARPGQPTWRPMVAAGWIEELRPTRGSMLIDQTWLRLTAAGREVLAPYTAALIKQEFGP